MAESVCSVVGGLLVQSVSGWLMRSVVLVQSCQSHWFNRLVGGLLVQSVGSDWALVTQWVRSVVVES